MPEQIPSTQPAALTPSASHIAVSAPTITAEASNFRGTAGINLHETRWYPVGEPRGCLVIVHGLKDYGARYGDLASTLAAGGIVTHATDLRGHGKSEGDRVWVNAFEDYLADLELSVQRARDSYPGVPLFLFGHSMGATIAALFTITRKPNLAGLILSAGSLKPAATLTLAQLAKAMELSVLSPRRKTLELKDELFSRDKAVVMRMKLDPMIDGGAGPARTAAELIAARERLQPREGEITAPLLVLHGSADQICNIEGSRELVERAGSTDKNLIVYDGFYHDLLHDLDHEVVLADIVKWIEARAAPRIPLAA